MELIKQGKYISGLMGAYILNTALTEHVQTHLENYISFFFLLYGQWDWLTGKRKAKTEGYGQPNTGVLNLFVIPGPLL